MGRDRIHIQLTTQIVYRGRFGDRTERGRHDTGVVDQQCGIRGQRRSRANGFRIGDVELNRDDLALTRGHQRFE